MSAPDNRLQEVTVEIHGKDTEDGFSRSRSVVLSGSAEVEAFLAEVEALGWRTKGFVTFVEPRTAKQALSHLREYASMKFHGMSPR